MTEAKRGEEKKRIPIYVHGPTRPKDGEGYTWVRDPDPWNTSRPRGWRRVSTTGSSDEEGFVVPEEAQTKESESPFPGGPTPEQLEKSRKKQFPSIEESLPRGDKD